MSAPAYLLVAVAALWATATVQALGGLTPEQEAWLESVSYGNVSSQWPLLSASQSAQLLRNVQMFQEITEQANYPYHQAVEVWYTDKNRSQIVYYDDVGDGASWTGLHLAALTHQYLATKDPATMERLWGTLETIAMMVQCTGKPGYIPRFVGLATDPAYAKYYANYGNGAYQCVAPYEDYVWLGYSSKDMYYGVLFGLTNVWVWLAPENTTISSKVISLTETIVDTLKEDHFWLVSPKNKDKLPVNPLPMFSASWRKLALTVNYSKYKDMDIAYVIDFWLAYETEMLIGSKYESYYPNELMVEGMYTLSVLEEDNGRKNALMKRFIDVVVEHSDHLQPGFAAFFLSAFPNTSQSAIPQGVLQGGLYDYPSAPEWDHYVDQSGNPKYMPHHDADHSDYALMIRDRPPTTYLWQRDPTSLKGGESACCFQRKHLDLILAYWMGRSSGYIGA